MPPAADHGLRMKHQNEQLKRSAPIPIDSSGKLSAPFLLGKKSAPSGKAPSWKDVDGTEFFGRSDDDSELERMLKEERDDVEKLLALGLSFKFRGRMAFPIPADNPTLDLREVEVEPHVAAVASEICRGITDKAILEDVRVRRISNALPRLPKELSQKVAGLSKPGTQKDAVKFVQQYRRHPASFFSIIS